MKSTFLVIPQQMLINCEDLSQGYRSSYVHFRSELASVEEAVTTLSNVFDFVVKSVTNVRHESVTDHDRGDCNDRGLCNAKECII